MYWSLGKVVALVKFYDAKGWDVSVILEYAIRQLMAQEA